MRRALSQMLVGALGEAVALVGVAVPAGAATDQEIADAGIIVDSDFTERGWFRSENSDSSEENLRLARKVKGCKDYVAFVSTFASTTDAISPEYTASSQELSNHSYVYRTEAAAEKAYKHATRPKIARCLRSLLEKQLEATIAESPQARAQIDDYRVFVERVPAVTDAVGDQSVGFTGGIEILGTDGDTERRQITSLVVRVGRVVITYSYMFEPSNGSPETFDSILANTLIRTEDALAS